MTHAYRAGSVGCVSKWTASSRLIAVTGYGQESDRLEAIAAGFDEHLVKPVDPQALAEYERCFCRAESIHSACEDYRASAGIDLEHDRASRARGQRIACDTLVLWGSRGVVQRMFKPLALWQAQSSGSVSGEALPRGHFVPEEAPAETAKALLAFY